MRTVSAQTSCGVEVWFSWEYDWDARPMRSVGTDYRAKKKGGGGMEMDLVAATRSRKRQLGATCKMRSRQQSGASTARATVDNERLARRFVSFAGIVWRRWILGEAGPVRGAAAR